MEENKTPEINQCTVNDPFYFKTETPEINHCTVNDLWQHKMGKGQTLHKWYSESWIFTRKKVKSDPCLMPYIKDNSGWIKDLNVSPETVKLLEESIRDNGFLTLILAMIS